MPTEFSAALRRAALRRRQSGESISPVAAVTGSAARPCRAGVGKHSPRVRRWRSQPLNPMARWPTSPAPGSAIAGE